MNSVLLVVVALLGAWVTLLPGVSAAQVLHTVSGEVLLPDGVDPAELRVFASVQGEDEENGDPVLLEEAVTELYAAGSIWRYSLVVPAGHYVIWVVDGAENIHPLHHSSVIPSGVEDPADATPVAVAGDVELPPLVGRRLSVVGGVVSVPSGRLVTEVTVTAHLLLSSGDYEPVATSRPDADGAFQMWSLRSGTYRFHFAHSESGVAGGWWTGHGNALAQWTSGALGVTVTDGSDLSRIDAVLALGGSIKGKLFDTTGSALPAGVRVVAQQPWTDDWGTGHWRDVAETTTQTDGTYLLTELEPGTYKVGVVGDADGWSNSYYPAGDTPEAGAEVTVRVAAVTHSIRFTVARTGTVAGTVALPGGVDSGEVSLTLHQSTPSGWVPAQTVWIDALGAYRFEMVPSGTYRLAMADRSGVAADAFHGGRTLATATDITLTPGSPDATVQLRMYLPADLPPDPVPPKPRPGIKVSKRAVITGTPAVGRTVKVTRGLYRPAKVKVKYQWFVRGPGKKAVRIKGATKPRLKVRSTWRGRPLQVRLTVTRSGHRTLSVTTKWSRPVRR